MQKYLDENCENHQFKLCDYRDSLPDRAYKFIWDEKSPFYKIGGWKDTKKEFNEIIYGTLTKPKFIFLHIKESFKATFDQLTSFSIGEGNGSFLDGTVLFQRISKWFSGDIRSYYSSKQNQSQLNTFVRNFNYLFSIIVHIHIPR